MAIPRSKPVWKLAPAVMAGVGLSLALAAGTAAQQSPKVNVFIGPAPLYDSIQMAESQGFLKEQGLDVTFQLFPTGTTALQVFRTGQGDMVTHGDLPGVSHWLAVNKDYRVISVIERDSKGYLATARKEITKAPGPGRQDRRHPRRVHRLVAALRVPRPRRRR